MNQLSLIQALTGVIPGQGANGNGSQGALAGSGAGLFSGLLADQLAGAAQAFQSIQPGRGPVGGLPVEASPDGASALLQVIAGAATDQASLAGDASGASAPGDPVHSTGAEGQVLFGLIHQAENNAAIENSPVLAAVLADDGSTTFAAGPNDQNIPAPFLHISAGAETGETGEGDTAADIVIGQLPAAASATAALASDKERAPAATPSSGEEGESAIDIALAIAPDGESITAAAKAVGPAEAPAAPSGAAARSDIAAHDAPRAARAESDTQSRPQLALKSSGEPQSGFESNAGGSGDLDGHSQQGDQQSGAQNTPGGKKGLGAGAGGISALARGIKTSVGFGQAAQAGSNMAADLPSSGQASGQFQSQAAPLRALENSMALGAGLILPFDTSAPIDPLTGMPTSSSAQSLAAGIQALQTGTSVSGPGQTTASFAHAPNFVAHQVGLQITKAVANGQNEFTIRLNPPELGRVEVRLEFLADGGVRAALSAEKPETLNLLQRDAAALERALNDAGVKTDSGSLNFSLQQGEAQAGHDDTNSTNGLVAAGEENEQELPADLEIEVTEQVIQQMVADGTVDIRV